MEALKVESKPDPRCVKCGKRVDLLAGVVFQAVTRGSPDARVWHPICFGDAPVSWVNERGGREVWS